jgi:hypothetical protein
VRIARAARDRNVAHRTVVTVGEGGRYDAATIADGGAYHLQRC